MVQISKQFLLLGFTLFGFLLDFSNSSLAPWKSDGGGQAKLENATRLTEAEFDGNTYASASLGLIVATTNSYCLGAMVSNQYFLYPELGRCIRPLNPPATVTVGSRFIYTYSPGFNGETYNIMETLQTAVSPLALAKISPNLTSKAKPVPLPPTSLLKIPPPVGTNCKAWGYGGAPMLNWLDVTIVSISDCKTRWGVFNSSVVVPEDGSVFCAWVTENGTAEALGSICNDFYSLIICEAWATPTPPKPPSPSCGWHKSGGGGGGGHKTLSDVLAMDQSRASPSYLLAGFFRTGTKPDGNCVDVGPPTIYTYTGGVISNI